jgi:hypothetical protein
MGYPLFLLYADIFDQSQHGISATKGKQTNLKEHYEKIRQYFHN